MSKRRREHEFCERRGRTHRLVDGSLKCRLVLSVRIPLSLELVVLDRVPEVVGVSLETVPRCDSGGGFLVLHSFKQPTKRRGTVGSRVEERRNKKRGRKLTSALYLSASATIFSISSLESLPLSFVMVIRLIFPVVLSAAETCEKRVKEGKTRARTRRGGDDRDDER